MANEYAVPTAARRALLDAGYDLAACDEMAPHIRRWDELFRAEGDFWDLAEERDGVRRKIHRMTKRPAKRVAREWASLIMDEGTTVSCDDPACTEWLNRVLERTGFFAKGQGLVMRAFALGTGAWALDLDRERGVMVPRRHDARTVLPLSWGDDEVTECAFCTRVSHGGRRLDQLQMHVLDGGTYHIRTSLWDAHGRPVAVEGVEPDFDTRGELPWFAIVRPAGENTAADFSPYGESVYADAGDILRSVDLCYDALMNEVDLAKMRIFISDMLVDYRPAGDDGGGRRAALPFGRDNTIFRKVQAQDGDLIKEYAPHMRTAEQLLAYRTAVQGMGDQCGLGSDYFDIDSRGGIRTAREVASDNSQLMRRVREHENLLGHSMRQVFRAMLHCGREFLGERLPDEGEVRVLFDDSIIEDTQALKQQDLSEVGLTMNPWEYRERWYGEDAETARANAPGAAVAAYEPPLG